jgi:hypothetical protein
MSLFWPKFLVKKKRNYSNDIKFKVVQVVDILFQNWFLVDPTFILLESNKEEGVGKSLLKV